MEATSEWSNPTFSPNFLLPLASHNLDEISASKVAHKAKANRNLVEIPLVMILLIAATIFLPISRWVRNPGIYKTIEPS